VLTIDVAAGKSVKRATTPPGPIRTHRMQQ
jgi:hypothetical protein